MKKLFKGALFLLLVALIAAGCSQPNAKEPTNSPNNGATENNLSPVPDEVVQKVKEDVTFYFADSDLMSIYRVKGEIEAESKDELPKIALEAWVKGPEQDGLTNLVPPEVVIEKLEFKDGIAYVSFSKEIKNANLGSGGESFLISQITLMMKQFGYESTQILVEGKAEESILGHVTTSEPIPAGDPEQYEWYQ